MYLTCYLVKVCVKKLTDPFERCLEIKSGKTWKSFYRYCFVRGMVHNLIKMFMCCRCSLYYSKKQVWCGKLFACFYFDSLTCSALGCCASFPHQLLKLNNFLAKYWKNYFAEVNVRLEKDANLYFLKTTKWFYPQCNFYIKYFQCTYAIL